MRRGPIGQRSVPRTRPYLLYGALATLPAPTSTPSPTRKEPLVNPVRFLARPMLASMFVVGGLDSLRNPQPKVPAADQVTGQLTDQLGDNVPAPIQDADTETLVRANGAAQVVGGTLLALGKLPRLSAAVLAATLVPTTMAGHRFWEETDEAQRANQQIHFFKNVSMMGGLLITAMDTQGKPGLAWRAGHAVEHAGMAADRTKREAKLATKLARAEAKSRANAATGRSRREAKLAGKLAKAEGRRMGAERRRATSEAKRSLTPDVVDLTKGVKRLRSSIGSND